MKKLIVPLLVGLAAPWALAKLPEVKLDPAAQVKAEEAKAKAAWQAKVDAFQLCKSQDRTVAHYRKTAASRPAAAPAGASPAGAAPAAPNTAAPATPSPAAAAAPATGNGSTTPVPVSTAQAAPSQGCPDPGPFAFTPPEQKPLEASGAHSPTGTASSPPSTNQTASPEPQKK